MNLVMDDVQIIRSVRILCLQHKFADAKALARKVSDANSRNTLMFICDSFIASQIRVAAA